MFDLAWIGDLDADGACDAVSRFHREQLRQEAQQLYLAAHWADLHNGDAVDSGGRTLPGLEQAKRLGGPGTPAVMEFAAAELAALQGMTTIAGKNLMRDALNLRHRHPLMWQRAISGEIRVWQARAAAKLVAEQAVPLSLEQARWIDEQVAPYVDSLPWGRFLELLQAKIIEADPKAAEARRKAAEAEQFVGCGRSNEYGLKTLVAKAAAGDVIYFVAICDRIAAILAAEGDAQPVGVRRAKAIGILANPARALRLLEDHAAPDAGLTGDAQGRPGEASATEADDEADDTADDDPIGEWDLHPSQNDAEESEDAARQPFARPATIDPSKLLPAATLYIHLSQEAFLRGHGGVARFEGVGPVTVEQAAAFLRHSHVTVKPVIDVAGKVAVDSYEVPAGMAEALHLRNPVDVFPFGTDRGRRKDKDHIVPYLSPDDGGPPGQTGLHNLGPLGRFHHRLKTHARWRVKQPEPGEYLWRSPHGWYWLVDHTGTRPLPRKLGDSAWTSLGLGIDIVPLDVAIEYTPARAA